MKRDVEFYEKEIEPRLGDAWDPPPGTQEDMYRLVEVTPVDGLDGWELGMVAEGSDSSSSTSGWILKRDDVPNHIKYKDGYDGPKVGDTIALYTTNGSTVVGIAVNGEPYFLKSEREVTLEWLLYRAKTKREDHESLERNRDQYADRIAALPERFQQRIARFRRNNPEFDTEYLGYELMCCEDAAKMAAWAEGVAALPEDHELRQEIEAWFDSEPTNYAGDKIERSEYGLGGSVLIWFQQQPYERQRQLVDFDEGHSGNSFGMAVFLGRAYIESPRHVPMIHGALATLVGSKDYGDLDPETGEPGGWPPECEEVPA